MVEASVLLFKQEVNTIKHLIRVYGQARGDITDSFKVVVDVYTNQKGNEGGKVCTRTIKAYGIETPDQFTLTKQVRESITLERVLGVEVKRLIYQVIG